MELVLQTAGKEGESPAFGSLDAPARTARQEIRDQNSSVRQFSEGVSGSRLACSGVRTVVRRAMAA